MLFTPLFSILLFGAIKCTTVTYKMAPHERACFYADAKVVGEKIGFYFAVQSGGNFDVDFDVTDPNVKILLSGQAERQGDYVLSANVVGEYAICFSNTMSTFAEKLMDFDITVQHEVDAGYVKSDLETKVGSIAKKPADKLGKLDPIIQGGIDHLKARISQGNSLLGYITRAQRNTRTNEHRNVATLKDAELRIFWFAFLECVGMIGMAVLQVYIIQSFFSKSVRTRV